MSRPSPSPEDRVRWEVDARPASLYTRAYLLGMRLARDKQAFEGARHTLRVARQRQRAGDAPPTVLTRATCRVERTRLAGLPAWVARPRRARPRARVVYVHGGGYIHPLTADYWRLVRSLVAAPADVVVPAYPLAPEADVDDVLPRLVQAVEEVAGQDPNMPVVLMGDSAGGALVLAMAVCLRDRGGPVPTRVVALSPWLDATLDDEAVRELEPTDPMLAESGLRAAGRWWSGRRDPANPLVSPVQADLHGLPPLEVFIGERDILRPAVDDLAEQADRAGADLFVHEIAAMFHVWMTRAIPEGRHTRRQLRRLVASRN